MQRRNGPFLSGRFNFRSYFNKRHYYKKSRALVILPKSLLFNQQRVGVNIRKPLAARHDFEDIRYQRDFNIHGLTKSPRYSLLFPLLIVFFCMSLRHSVSQFGIIQIKHTYRAP